jgi:RNA polymerase sigma factor for flagellar operon FliA
VNRRSTKGLSPVDNEAALVELHLPLVAAIARNIHGTLPPHVEYDDLYSSGLLGLLFAVRNFRSAHPASLRTYAGIRIRGEIFDELRRTQWIPRQTQQRARKVAQAILELEAAHGRAPTDAEMARALNLSVATWQRWQQEVRPPKFYCLNAPPHDPDAEQNHYATEFEIADQVEGPSAAAERHEAATDLAARLEQLRPMQRIVMDLYYARDMKFLEIAELFELTESRICQIHREAIRSLQADSTLPRLT